MAVEVFAWNVAGGFGDRDRATGILEVIKDQQPTAAVFSEAWEQGGPRVFPRALSALEEMGYALTPAPYNDYGNEIRDDRQVLLGIVREEAVAEHSQVVRIASRNAIKLSVADGDSGEAIDFFGIHLNDRNEDGRLQQAEALLDLVGDAEPVVIGGDFNAMHRKGAWPQALHTVAPLLRPVPEINYAPGYKPPKVHRTFDRLRRASAMACGSVLQTFVDADFQDTHPQHRPTISVFNVDHILARGPRVVSRQIHPQTPFSDHRAISAVLA